MLKICFWRVANLDMIFWSLDQASRLVIIISRPPGHMRKALIHNGVKTTEVVTCAQYRIYGRNARLPRFCPALCERVLNFLRLVHINEPPPQ